MAVIFQEDFETDGNAIRYFTSVPEFTDNGGDFFIRTDETNIGSYYNLTGQSGSYYFAAMDTNGDGGPTTLTITFAPINITGYSNLQFSGLFAEDDDGSNQDWDADTYVLLEYQIDGGGWNNLLAFAAAGGTNTEPMQDTNFDGVGNGTALTDVFTSYTNAIVGTGSSLELRVTLENLESGDEDFAFDNFSVEGDFGPPAPAVNIIQSGGSTNIAEGGATDTFDVGLTVAPTSQTDVTLTVSDGETEISVDGVNFFTSLTLNFTTTATQTITVRAIDDAHAELTHSGTIAFSVSQPGGSMEYDAMAVADISASITDNDFAITRIHTIQGATDTSALVGQTVTIEAVVVGDFQDGDADTGRNLRGFFLQEEDADADANALTSEGIFVFEGGNFITDVNVGDIVQVTGTVGEFFGSTQLSSISSINVISSGNAMPTAAQISLPSAGVSLDQGGGYQADLEAYEGMLVEFVDALSISEMFQLDRFGEITLTEGGRIEQFTQTNLPDVAGYDAHLQNFGSRSIIYDDGQNVQNGAIDLDGFATPFNTGNAFGMGDTITSLSGVLDFSWAGNAASGATWRVRSTQDGENTFVNANPRESTPESVGDDADVKVASMNVLNYFTTLSGTTANGSSPRGADNAAEFARQSDKLVDAILEMDVDVLGLIEIENDFLAGSSGNAVEYLVGQLNAVAGAGTYAWVDPGTQFVGGDAIANAAIYKTASVQLKAGTTVEVLTDADLAGLGLTGPRFDGSGTNRAVLAVTFEDIGTGEDFTISVSHMKSKGSVSAGAGNQGIGDGAGNNNQMRLDGVEALNAWLATDPTGAGNAQSLLLGDFNAYAMEDPITYLEGLGFTDLAQEFIDDPYSYVFGGQTGTLDYIFSSLGLTPYVTGATEWHVNSDEADVLDYNTDFGRNASIFDGTTPYRYSDHDPVIIGLNLDPYIGLYSEVSLVTLERGSDYMAVIMDAASDGDAIDVLDEAALGNIGNVGVATNNLTVFADVGFTAQYTLLSGVANLTLGGTAGATIIGGAQDNTLTGADGDDVLAGGQGNDILIGNNGDDTIYTGEGVDNASGGAGADTILGGTSTDYIQGGADNDSLYGRGGNDVISGGDGNDLLAGEGGNDQLSGGLGDDNLSGGNGNDTLYGGGGADNLYGSTGDDVLNGGSGADTLVGGADNDTLNGGAGADTLYGGNGMNMLDGGADNDLLVGGGDMDTLSGSSGDDTIYAQAGNDLVYGGLGGDSLFGNAGDDVVYGNDGADTLSGAAGVDTLYGGAGNDLIYGGTDNDALIGDDGDDSLFAGAGNDQLLGGAGNDRLYAQSGANLLDGGAGNDIYYASSGADTLFFDADDGSATERVSGYDMVHTVQLDSFAYANAAASYVDFTQSGTNVLFSSAGVTIIFYGATLADVRASVIVSNMAELPNQDKDNVIADDSKLVIFEGIDATSQDLIAEVFEDVHTHSGAEMFVNDFGVLEIGDEDGYHSFDLALIA